METELLVAIVIVIMFICITVCSVHANHCQLKLKLAELKEEKGND